MPLAERRHLLPGAAAFAAALLVALLGLNADADPPPRVGEKRERFVELQLLGMNDLHGRLEPPEPGVGGAAWLGAWLDRVAASHPGRTIRVHAGDMVGASPLISSHFKDEPTIEATNRMELDVGTLGNHEFDEGGAEALRLVQRARYPYIAANTVTREGGELILPPYEVVERDGVRVGFIGVTTIEEIVDETQEMDDAVDAVVAGHTHSRLNVEADGKLVIEAFSYGVAFDRVRMTVDRRSGDVVEAAGTVLPTRHEGIEPDPDLAELVDTYAERVAPLADRVVGHLPHDLDKPALDQTAADAHRAFAGADIAILNPGNTRRPALEAGPVTYAEAFEVHAYEHPVWRMRMRGAELMAIMAAQPKLLVSGPRELEPDAVYTVAANGIVAERAPFAGAVERELVGTDLEALVAWLGR
jgi:5'-nucleotidase